jgi:hypothetical protein
MDVFIQQQIKRTLIQYLSVSSGNRRRTAPTDEGALDILALSVRADPASLAVPLYIRGPSEDALAAVTLDAGKS